MFDLQSTGPDTAREPASNGASADLALERDVRALAQTDCASSPPRLELGAEQRLWLRRGGSAISVRPVRCFPWSSPDELISLRDAADEEQLLVVNGSELDAPSREALAHAMLASGFVLRIEAVLSIEVDYEVRLWRTRTGRGSRTFQTRLDEWPWPSPAGGHLLRDLAGDLYHLPPLETLDAETRRQLWPYVG